ncbi:UNVERIFIED_CONTAM: hypothetical protein FKN15_005094 [Acipenser sinensis]
MDTGRYTWVVPPSLQHPLTFRAFWQGVHDARTRGHTRGGAGVVVVASPTPPQSPLMAIPASPQVTALFPVTAPVLSPAAANPDPLQVTAPTCSGTVDSGTFMGFQFWNSRSNSVGSGSGSPISCLHLLESSRTWH